MLKQKLLKLQLLKQQNEEKDQINLHCKVSMLQL